MISDSISLPCSGCFSPFPYGTSSLSVSLEYLALPDGAGRFTQNFSGFVLLRIPLGLKNLTCTGLSPSMEEFSKTFHFNFKIHVVVLQPHYCRNNNGLGYSPFARHYLGNHYCFLFLCLLRCFSSAGSLSAQRQNDQMVGLPHSEISGFSGYSAPTRSLSQPITSFIASESQGIHHTLLFAF
jgi:hypothetical protein